MVAVVGKIKRSLVATFINVTPAAAATYERLGEGVTAGSINYNPETSSEVYIHEDSGTTSIDSYSPVMPIEAQAINGDPVFEFVDALRKARAVGAAAETDIINVWLYETATTGTYPAEQQSVSIQVDSFGGPGGETAAIGFTINFLGDPVVGTYNPTTDVFTPA